MQDQIIEKVISPNIVNLTPVNIFDSLISLIFAGLFGWLIATSYRYSSQSISGGRQIISSILPLTLSVCVIITIVKSSLALSLGLVGALSIVRFRTPVKDPEDLVYLFLAIVTGLGFGANQNIFSAVGVSCILIILALRSFLLSRKIYKLKSGFDFNLNIEWQDSNDLSLSRIVDVISKSCDQISFIRIEKFKSSNIFILQVNLFKDQNIEKLIKDISELNSDLSIQVYDASVEY